MSNYTIFALATAPGKSGVAIIRISGKDSLPCLKLLTGKQGWQPNNASLSVIRNPSSGETIDTALALFFQAPKSFTGEDVVELHLHGSLAVIRETLEMLAQIPGLKPAERGEFTRRAFLNGKMDLIQAEGLMDLIASETVEQKRQSQRQMQGGMSGYYNGLRAGMIKALAHLEAYIDFPDEEIPESVLAGLACEIDSLKSTISSALADGQRGEKLREGLQIVILGAPNAGKSSLLNALARRDAAIVSHKAGTTRDVIEVHLDIRGFPVTLMDTAGLRDSFDEIEEEGIRRALNRAESADLKLIVFDAASEKIDEKSRELIDESSLVIINKSDLLPAESVRKPGTIFVSAKTGQGVDDLIAKLEEKIVSIFNSDNAPMITQNRHRARLSEALSHLELINFTAPLELICEELRLSANCVAKITGKIGVDDVLDVVFKEFCIGK